MQSAWRYRRMSEIRKTVNACFRRSDRVFGHVDVLVNNAGISIIGLLQDLSFEDWNRIVSANLSSVFHCAKLAIPGMIHNHSGQDPQYLLRLGSLLARPVKRHIPRQKAASTDSRWLSQKNSPRRISRSTRSPAARSTPR